MIPTNRMSPMTEKPEIALDDDHLLDLQSQVLDALEGAGHPEFGAANSDPALKDRATASQRKAWLAIYGPMTEVAI
jgi:hypothetical protein